MSQTSFTDHYQVLGISRRTTAHQIKEAYRAKALALHPDKNFEVDTTTAFQKLSDSYQVLSDVDARFYYNREYEKQFSNQKNSEPNIEKNAFLKRQEKAKKSFQAKEAGRKEKVSLAEREARAANPFNHLSWDEKVRKRNGMREDGTFMTPSEQEVPMDWFSAPEEMETQPNLAKVTEWECEHPRSSRATFVQVEREFTVCVSQDTTREQLGSGDNNWQVSEHYTQKKKKQKTKAKRVISLETYDSLVPQHEIEDRINVVPEEETCLGLDGRKLRLPAPSPVLGPQASVEDSDELEEEEEEELPMWVPEGVRFGCWKRT